MQNVYGKILATLINDVYVCWNGPLSKSSWAIEIVVSKGQVSTVSTLLRISERGFQQRKRCTLNIRDWESRQPYWGDRANMKLVIFPILFLLFAASSGQSTLGKFLRSGLPSIIFLFNKKNNMFGLTFEYCHCQVLICV